MVKQDFIILARDMGLGSKGESLARTAFRSLDKNRNGRLDKNEVFGALNLLKKQNKETHGYRY